MKWDRRISIALVFAVIVQTAGALMWAGAADARLAMLDRDALESRTMVERLARIEAELEAARAQLDRIEGKLDRI